eukprot:2237789-Amphidinium_carterae.1
MPFQQELLPFFNGKLRMVTASTHTKTTLSKNVEETVTELLAALALYQTLSLSVPPDAAAVGEHLHTNRTWHAQSIGTRLCDAPVIQLSCPTNMGAERLASRIVSVTRE